MNKEIPVSFLCRDDLLYGILHLPEQALPTQGLLIVVGGPQYRVGSHRQFVLLAREITKIGIPVLRFDYRGMGDSDGETGQPEPCEHLDLDIRSAIDCLTAQVPSLKEITILGLCDGATSAILYSHTDPRVSKIVLLNPWSSNELNEAKTFLKDYYFKRLFSRDFWLKVIRMELNVVESFLGFIQKVVSVVTSKIKKPNVGTENINNNIKDKAVSLQLNDRILLGLQKFHGNILLILSGIDSVAFQFKLLLNDTQQGKALLNSSNMTIHYLPEADHTFATHKNYQQLIDWINAWLKPAL